MYTDFSPKVQDLHQRVKTFLNESVFPQYERREQEIAANAKAGDAYRSVPVVDELKAQARGQGLWNLFLPESAHGFGLSNLEYAPIAEMMGRQYWSAEVFNCSAPDTGNMEVLERYGTEAQKERWLKPLLAGEIRSAFAMTEPAVASSDATNIECRIVRDGDDYVINGRKWYITGAAAEACKVFVLMGKTDPGNPNRHRQQSMILVPKDTPGVTIVRDMALYGFMDPPAGHPEVLFENVRVPASNILLGEGRGFEIAQGRLGPGRIHHCMRVVGMAEAALALMCKRVVSRVAFHKPLSDQGVWRERIAKSRTLIDQTRLLVLHAAHRMDTVGNKVAAKEIAMIKVAAPNNCCKVIDWAIQAHGAGGFSQDFLLTSYYAYARHLRTADGPDEVHNNAIAKQELAPYLAALAEGNIFMNKTFSGQVALVTGAGNGIGRATAVAFAAQGIKVVVSDVDVNGGEGTVALIRDAGGTASFVRCDVALDADVKALVEATVAAYGRLDYAFNNAGIDIEKGKLADGSEAEFDAIMDVNVKGVWLCMKYELATMLKQGGGAIVNTASVAGLIAAPKMGIYAASKHAVMGLTKSAAVEYGKKNIRVNAVCPAVIDTEMFRRAKASDPKKAEIAVLVHPVGRIGRVEEIAAAVLYLCSDAAGFTTGIGLPVDGGLTAC